MLATLADLLAPVSISEFLEAFRARKRLHIVATDPARAETLFSWRDIDTLLSEHALDENVKIMRDGVRLPRQMYTSNEGKQLNVRAFHDLLPQGVSIVVNYVQRSIPQSIRQANFGEVERFLAEKGYALLCFYEVTRPNLCVGNGLLSTRRIFHWGLGRVKGHIG